MNSARDFFGNSVGSLKSQLEDDRSQLQALLDHLPASQESIRPQLKQLLGSYEDIQYMMVRAIQKQEVEDTAAEQAVQRSQNAASETERLVSEAADHLPPNNALLGGITDEQGRTILRSVDRAGEIMETELDKSGAPVREEVTGTVADLPAQKESTDEKGQTIRAVEDESGKSISLTLDEEGEVLDLEVSEETDR